MAHGRREQKLSMNESGMHFRSTAGIQRANTNPNILYTHSDLDHTEKGPADSREDVEGAF